MREMLRRIDQPEPWMTRINFMAHSPPASDDRDGTIPGDAPKLFQRMLNVFTASKVVEKVAIGLGPTKLG